MDGDQTPKDSSRSPWWWAGVLVLVVAFGLFGATRAFPFDPDGWLGRWYVQAAVTSLGIILFIGGFWLVTRGRPGRQQETHLPE